MVCRIMALKVYIDIPLILQALFGVVALFVLTPSIIRAWEARAKLFQRERDREIGAVPRKHQQHDTRDGELQLYKDLYFKLHHLERYPEILSQSRDLLITLFSETLAEALRKTDSGILSVEHYTRESLASFMRGEDYSTAQMWEQYLARRKAGGPTEMFRDREEARWWLRQITPVKYIDGAWLGYINKITTPFALRRTVKDAFQVLSEELGDGDLAKNHVHVYRQLMTEIEPGLPPGDSEDFIHPRHQISHVCIWKAALTQLLISLFPHEFLPEILGFNMHFEGVSLETLKAAKELKELSINPYYFLLHISIDNADSGHTAMAMQTVDGYIEHVRKSYGDSAAQQAWRRVQAGFILSAGLPTTPDCATLKAPGANPLPYNEHEAELARIFKAKSLVAHKIHCSSGMKIGRHTLVDWLEPSAWASKQWQMDFLRDLSNMKPWVRKGDSRQSKLIQELSWEGRMFGSFTQTEVEVVRQWIDSLGNPDIPQIYWSFTGQPETSSSEVLQNQDICVDYPVFSLIPAKDLLLLAHPLSISSTLPLTPTSLPARATPNIAKLLPLWFAHPCLLESFVCIPAKTTTKVASSILCLLRAQSGFTAEGPGVAGMDEVRRVEGIGLVELGLEMIRRHGLPEPTCLKEVLGTWHSEFALLMLHLSMRPMENRGLLLGVTSAFVSLYDVVAASTLLSAGGSEALAQMADRGRHSLQICLAELRDDEAFYADYCRGQNVGRAEIESCFAENGADGGTLVERRDWALYNLDYHKCSIVTEGEENPKIRHGKPEL
ncbi:hypothetical protein DFP73DRAFT_561702 [Morchella snyderi]|nr:hypothetical protein DFP73DRAFT_561702 [Morchella snyderi]